MNVLLHACCAPCSIQCIDSLRGEGHDVTLFWYNPNIHPYTEYRSRKNALVDYARDIGAPLMLRDAYGLRSFLSAVHPDYDARCGYCYRVRMEETARAAAENGFDAFSTTLLISPYQNHDLIRQTGEELAGQCGIAFLYRDFRPLFRLGQNMARERNLYRQKYCGCIFSEEERYQKKKPPRAEAKKI